MKHLKRFNESNQFNQSVIDDCKDILLELEDIGIKTNVRAGLDFDFVSTIEFAKLGKEYNNKWIQFFFSRKEEFNYSDIEDVVERLKSYLSEYNLHIQWQSPTERKENKPTIKTTRVMNPTNFRPEGVRTECEFYFLIG